MSDFIGPTVYARAFRKAFAVADEMVTESPVIDEGREILQDLGLSDEARAKLLVLLGNRLPEKVEAVLRGFLEAVAVVVGPTGPEEGEGANA